MHSRHFRNASTHLLSWGWCVLVVSFLSACGSDITPVGYCTAAMSLAVVVTVRDSVSRQGAADGAIGTLVGEGVDDTLRNVDSLTILGGDSLGTYVVTIDRPGYLTWTKSNVQVTKKGSCGNVIPVMLDANLQPVMP